MNLPPARSLGALGLFALPHQGAADPGTAVSGVVLDSRAAGPGSVFVAVPGTRTDGAQFAAAAIAQGAAAIVATPEGAALISGAPVFVTDQPRLWAARLASAFYASQPSVMVAVTGTNGKTSTTEFLRQIWALAGRRAAAFGTTGVTGPDFTEALGMTTPDPVTLHGLLARLAERGVTHAAMEASSHGLAQHRLDGVRLTAAGLSNITRDHMDYHASHEDYVAAKLRLFGEVLAPGETAVLNSDDPVYPQARAAALAHGARVIAVGRAAGADLAIQDARYSPAGQTVRLVWQGRTHPVALALIGGFQADNVGLAAGLALATGLTADEVFAALPRLHGVRGRMQRVATRANGAAVYVDYAHTPDALATALAALRLHCPGRIAVVFGAGGDRDAGKRALMGAAVATRADVAIVTDDNPRSEAPAAIRRAVIEGAPRAYEIADRSAAILAGLDALSGPGDALLIAGKGHEQGQEVAGRVLPFDDATQARAAVIALDGMQDRMGGGR